MMPKEKIGKLDFFIDENGLPRVKAPPGLEGVALFLEGDIQGDAAMAQELLNLLEESNKKGSKDTEFIGNSYAVIIRPEQVVLEALYSRGKNSKITLKRDEFKEIVKKWLNFIKQ